MVHDFKFHFHNFHVEHDHVEVCHLKVSRKLLVNPSICNSASALVYILKAVAYSCLDASAALSMKNVEASQTFHLARAVSCRTWFQRSVLGSRCFTWCLASLLSFWMRFEPCIMVYVDWLTYFICWFAKVDSSALQVSLIDASLSDYFTQHYIPKSLFAAFAWALVHVFKCVFLFTSCGSIFCFHASNSKITMGRWAGELSCAAMVCITGVTLHIPGFATESADWISCYMAIWSFAICSNEKSVSYDYVSPGCCRVRTSFDHVAAAFLERVTFSHDTWHMWYVKCKWHMSCNATRWGEIMCGWRAQHSCKHQTICRG